MFFTVKKNKVSNADNFLNCFIKMALKNNDYSFLILYLHYLNINVEIYFIGSFTLTAAKAKEK